MVVAGSSYRAKKADGILDVWEQQEKHIRNH